MLFAPAGDPVKTEDAPIADAPPAAMRPSVEALRYLEETVTGAEWTEGIVLRYGLFYGPGTSLDPGGEHARMIRARRLPLIGRAGGIWSFIHVDDAADATVAALERGRRGVYHVTDDEPAPVSAWLPAAAAALGAKPPLRIPRWLGRLLAGGAATLLMTESRGASNAKAKQELGWAPAHPTWRTGLAEALA